jgi:hypothetical protein
MLRNLMVSFEIRDWLRQGALVVGAIEELGIATRIFGNTWHVRSALSAEEAATRVRDVLDATDGLCVIDASAEMTALINVEEHAVDRLRQLWHYDGSAEERAA